MEEYFKVAKVADIPEGQGRGYEVNGLPIGIFNLGGNFYAISNLCSHVAAPLSEGTIDGENVLCPWHGAIFHIPTGKALCMPAQRSVDTFPIRICGDDIKVKVVR